MSFRPIKKGRLQDRVDYAELQTTAAEIDLNGFPCTDPMCSGRLEGKVGMGFAREHYSNQVASLIQ